MFEEETNTKVLEIYQVSVALRGFELGNDVMSDQAENVLNSWVSLVMLTLWQLGLTPRGTESTAAGKREDPKFSRDALGMLGFVKQTIAMVEGGMNLVKVQELQAVSALQPIIKLPNVCLGLFGPRLGLADCFRTYN